MRRIFIAPIALGLANIADAHTLSRDHDLAETLWHQAMGSHHLPYTIGIVLASVVLYLAARWVSNHRER